ncbi:hypothetical protein HQ531_06040 [bacterium]|nr:hypothetical protein [bacterium]
MFKSLKITNEILFDYLQKEAFNVKDLQRDVKIKGGIMRVAPGYPITERLQDLKEEGALNYNAITGDVVKMEYHLPSAVNDFKIPEL